MFFDHSENRSPNLLLISLVYTKKKHRGVAVFFLVASGRLWFLWEGASVVERHHRYDWEPRDRTYQRNALLLGQELCFLFFFLCGEGIGGEPAQLLANAEVFHRDRNGNAARNERGY